MNLVERLLPVPSYVVAKNKLTGQFEKIKQTYIYTVRLNTSLTLGGYNHPEGHICTMLERDYNYYKSIYGNAISMFDRRIISI